MCKATHSGLGSNLQVRLTSRSRQQVTRSSQLEQIEKFDPAQRSRHVRIHRSRFLLREQTIVRHGLSSIDFQFGNRPFHCD